MRNNLAFFFGILGVLMACGRGLTYDYADKTAAYPAYWPTKAAGPTGDDKIAIDICRIKSAVLALEFFLPRSGKLCMMRGFQNPNDNDSFQWRPTGIDPGCSETLLPDPR